MEIYEVLKNEKLKTWIQNTILKHACYMITSKRRILIGNETLFYTYLSNNWWYKNDKVPLQNDTILTRAFKKYDSSNNNSKV